MIIELNIPDEFVEHYNEDKFVNSLRRIEYDLRPCLEFVSKDYMFGRYEVELVEMLLKAFRESKGDSK
jgi:hypothetical protein